jgi:hypothetical protein
MATPVPRALTVALVALLGAPAQPAAAEAPVIHLRDPAGLARSGAPVTLGVPLPAGLHQPEARLGLRGADGVVRPCQTRALERWQDGTVRWMLVDFLARLTPGEATSLTLIPTEAEEGAAAGLEFEAGPPVALHTGVLDVRVAADGAMTLQPPGQAAAAVTIAPPVVTARTPRPVEVTSVRLETKGAVRTEVVIEGRHGADLVSTIRVAAFAGMRSIRLRHTLMNRGVRDGARLTGITLSVPTPGATAAEVVIDDAVIDVALGETPRIVRQTSAAAVTIDGAEAGTHANGAVGVRTDTMALTVVVPELWQQYPKGFTVGADRLTVDLLPAPDDVPIVLGLGAAKTHEVWIRLAPPDEAAPLATTLARLANPVRGMTDPAWSRATGAIHDVLAPDFAPATEFLTRLRSDTLRYDARGRHERWDEGPPGPCQSRTTAAPRLGFYGALNWGDWNFPGYRDDVKECDAWGNLEYDLPFVFGLAWASTADPFWAARFERAVRHYRDVDVIHEHPTHPEWVGLNHPHKVGHFDPRAKAKTDLGHTWLEGLLLHHRLTGDRRSRTVALGMADRLTERLHKARNARQFGWPMVALAAAFDATGDPRYRDAALGYARAAMERFEPTPTSGDWKMGVLAGGVMALHRATADSDARAWLTQYGMALFGLEKRAEIDVRYLTPMGYVARLGNSPPIETYVVETTAEMPIGNWGKPLAMHGRTGFRLLGSLPLPAEP